MKIQPPNQKHLVVMMHRLEQRGGQERSTLEILIRLVKLGWKIEVYSFRLSDWPVDLPIVWHRIPGKYIPIQLLKNIWFQLVVFVLIGSRSQKDKKNTIFVTIGTASLRADVRIIQFVHDAFRKLLVEKKVSYPNVRSILHRLYQVMASKWYAYMERKFVFRSQALIAISNRVKGEVLPLLRESSPPTHVIHHASDATKNVNLQLTKVKTPVSDGVPLILFVGALERKGISKALRVLSAVRELDWRFWVLGEGNIPCWRKSAIELGIGARVIFLGERPAHSYFDLADIFFLPSVYEPFGLVVTEAASHGCVPLVSCECGAMELWKDREGWLNLSCQDPDAVWAEALRRLLMDKTLRDKTGVQATEAFRQWTWDKAAQAYATVFESVREGRDAGVLS